MRMLELNIKNDGKKDAINPQILIMLEEKIPDTELHSGLYVTRQLGQISYREFETFTDTPTDQELATVVSLNVTEDVTIIPTGHIGRFTFGCTMEGSTNIFVFNTHKSYPVFVTSFSEQRKFKLIGNAADLPTKNLTDGKFRINCKSWAEIEIEEITELRSLGL